MLRKAQLPSRPYRPGITILSFNLRYSSKNNRILYYRLIPIILYSFLLFFHISLTLLLRFTRLLCNLPGLQILLFINSYLLTNNFSLLCSSLFLFFLKLFLKTVFHFLSF